ncbi:MAG: iron-containing redox enzyme family protein [Burkholderiaceae bacterium]|nr:iron-containing redox enzyme family protein [Burkholderiaceae bacterium]
MADSFVQRLRTLVDEDWATIKAGRFWNRVLSQPVTVDLYRDLMLQIYHYSSHNSMNQAAVAIQPAPEALLKFVYRHAAEELGHERMVVRDLQSIGALREGDLARPPLPATEALMGYLYFVSFRYGAIPRLGYSFWAEGVYPHIRDVFAKISRDLTLEPRNVTFFGSHAQADAEHIQQVEDCIERFALTPEQQEAVTTVARTTLFLTGQLLEQVAALHEHAPVPSR